MRVRLTSSACVNPADLHTTLTTQYCGHEQKTIGTMLNPNRPVTQGTISKYQRMKQAPSVHM